MEPDGMKQITDIVKTISEAHSSLGMLGAIAAALTVLVRAVRLPLVQRGLGAIDPRLEWSRWPKGVKLAFVFGLSTAGAIVGAIAGQAPISVSVIISGLAVGLASIAVNEATEAVGVAAQPITDKLPAAVRRPVGLMFPVPKSLEELRAIEAKVEK